MNAVEIYTDGSCDNVHSRVGGWAALLRFGPREKILVGSETDTTSIRMELTAAAEALESLLRPCVVRLYTDSQFLVKGVTGRFRRLSANADLWARIFEQKARHDIEWVHVPGHAGVQENERVHEIALREYRKRLKEYQERPDADVLDIREAQRKVADAEWPEASVRCARRYADSSPESITYHRLLPLISDFGDEDPWRITARGREGVLLNVIGDKARVLFDDVPVADYAPKKRPHGESEEVYAVEVKPLLYTSKKAKP